MAMKIIASRNEGMKDGKNYLRAELIADSASDLSIEGMSNYHFTFGSIAYVIDEKSFYVLNSSGTWVSSSEGGEDVTPNGTLNNMLNCIKESEGTGEMMEEIPETETLKSKEVT